MATLIQRKGDAPGRQHQLDTDRIILGRNPECNVVLANTSVSREHATIFRVGNQFYVEDNRSRNGTKVNHQPIAGRTVLKENDSISICDFEYSFHHDQPPPEWPVAPVKKSPFPTPPVVAVNDTDPDDPPSGPVGFKPEASVSHASSFMILEAQPAEKLKLLLDITTKLSRTLELDGLLPQIVDCLFQMFRQADRCFVIMLDEATGNFVPKVIKTRRDKFEATARYSRTIIRKSLETVQGFLSDDAFSDSKLLSESIAGFHIRSVICAPLWGQNEKAFGVIQLDSQDRMKKFTQDDLNLLMGVARQASIALENARLHEALITRERLKRDLELASQVQRGFLPKRLPQVKEYEFFAYYEPAQAVGGDYYDFIPLTAAAGGSNRLAVMIGDVAGKGVPAALLMGKLNSDARFCMLTTPEPAPAVGELNELLGQAGLVDRFVTLAACVLDPVEHTIDIVNAGHMVPYVYRRASGAIEDGITNDQSGIPLGVMDGFPYESVRLTLEPGDSVILFTDGVNEAMNVRDELFDLAGLQKAIRASAGSAAEIGMGIVKAVKQHAANRSQSDDITLVCFGRLTEPDSPAAHSTANIHISSPHDANGPETGPRTERLPKLSDLRELDLR